MLIKNEEIIVNVLDKNRKLVKTITKKNRVVNNFLDWAIFHQLPDGIGGSTFPKFANIEQSNGSGLNKKGVSGCYIKFTTKDVIDDTSTNFSYDLVDYPGNTYYSKYNGSGNIANATQDYEFEIDATYADQLLTQVGFGLFNIDILANPFNDWLTAWIDVDLLGIRIPEGFILQVQRRDYATNEKNVGSSLGAMYILQEQAKIRTIDILNETGESLYTYDINNVTVTNTGIGEIEISGIGTFSYCDTTPYYPCDDLYPCDDIYPSGGNLSTVRIYYEWVNLTSQNDFYVEYETIDLDVTYNGDVITLKIIIERGDI